MSASYAERLKKGLEECLAHVEGQLELRTETVSMPAPPPVMRPRDIVATRRNLNMTPAGFAQLLNVSPTTLKRWERGESNPSAAALRLLQIARERPDELCAVAGCSETTAGGQTSAA